MNKRIFAKVTAYIERYRMIAAGDSVVVGVSGGADSVCLLLMLCELAKTVPIRIAVVHVNHGIREQAHRDAEFVKELCEKKGILFYLTEVDVKEYAETNKLSVEEAGRVLRYSAFDAAMKDAEKRKIAVAHNANDRVETMLFHLFRGTGLSGVSGIKPVRDSVIRPLLCLDRKEIEEFLEEENISFCWDHTNEEDVYIRNRIRHHILPYAEKEICGGAAAHMWQTADILLETEDYIKKQTDAAFAGCAGMDYNNEKQIALKIDELIKEDIFIQKCVLMKCLDELHHGKKDIMSVHILAIAELLKKQGSKQISLPYGMTAIKEYNFLIIRKDNSLEREDTPESKEKIFLTEIPGSVNVPCLGEVDFSVFSYEKTQIIPQKSYTKWFDYDRITKSLVFRTRETGDFLTINEQLSRKKLKDYMIGEKIPKDRRSHMYILAEGSHVLWVPGYRISQYYKVTENTKRILEVRLRGGI